MPTVPNFTNDGERIAWLRRWFADKGDFDATVNAWDTTVQRLDSAVSGAGYVAATTVTVLSGIQSILTTNSSENKEAIEILSYVQTGLGLALIALGAVCKLMKDNRVKPRDMARHEFSPAFFATQGTTPAEIWKNPPESPPLDGECTRVLCLGRC